ncbi:acyltransferase family protein [Microvirga arabica]|uniref:acyltransferase family protein n=1 Tax=Microvirga arabica TaxID=1128671 RepID=UPI0019393A55|nr:acyltransferase [Microvirga arabica]MBM1174567.1 acyltransferase [Microvirga arabica]
MKKPQLFVPEKHSAAIDSVRPTVIGLDVLRFFAALLVIGYHYFFLSWAEPAGWGGVRDAVGAEVTYSDITPFTWWSWVGAELFFVISGFVITMSAVGKSATDFAIERAARLLPALLVFSTLSLIVVLGEGLLRPGEAFYRWAKALVLLPNGPWIDGVIWTLTVELVFYAAIFAVLVTNQITRLFLFTRIAAQVIALFWVLVAITRYLADLGPLDSIINYGLRDTFIFRHMLLTTGSFFLLGMFAYEVFTRGLTVERSAYLALTGLCSFGAIVAKASRSVAVTELDQNLLVPALIWLLCCAACALSLAYEKRNIASERVRRRARALGLVTYPLYLVHNIAGAWVLGRLYEAGLDRWGAAVAATAVCVAVSYWFATRLERHMHKMIGGTLRRVDVHLRAVKLATR